MFFDTKDKTEAIINLIWDREAYYIVTAGKDAPSKQHAKEVAARYGVRLPADYIAHVTGYWGSLYLEVKEHLWPRHKAGDVGPFWSFLYGLYVYAYSEQAPDWMQIGLKADEFAQMGHKVLPILKIVGDADVYCFDAEGEIQRWQHETDTFEPFKGSFFDLLEYEFKELDERRKRKLAERAGPPTATPSLSGADFHAPRKSMLWKEVYPAIAARNTKTPLRST